ncbi:exported protein of unknown function [Tenacibaculum sp. 190130A14a]|uniref:Lipoprotein n=1 Tax=Tenacibaculum polynesiense TaxID=3137857 RepID=A0ABM9P919_9FLAO
MKKLLFLTTLLTLLSCKSTVHMYVYGLKNFDVKSERDLLKVKKKFLHKERDAQIIQPPKVSEGVSLTNLAYYGKAKSILELESDNFHVVDVSSQLKSLNVEKLSGDRVEKIIINSTISISPYESGWLDRLISSAENLPKGEHRIQFTGPEFFNPGTINFQMILLTVLREIDFSKGFRISYTFDEKYNMYISSIWLTKR